MSLLHLGADRLTPSRAVYETDEPLTTPFEDWCEAHGCHPEAHGAWECFTQQAYAG